jgi:hypothetical protein
MPMMSDAVSDRSRAITSANGTNSPFAAVQRFRLQLEELRTCWEGAEEACS